MEINKTVMEDISFLSTYNIQPVPVLIYNNSNNDTEISSTNEITDCNTQDENYFGYRPTEIAQASITAHQKANRKHTHGGSVFVGNLISTKKDPNITADVHNYQATQIYKNIKDHQDGGQFRKLKFYSTLAAITIIREVSNIQGKKPNELISSIEELICFGRDDSSAILCAHLYIIQEQFNKKNQPLSQDTISLLQDIMDYCITLNK